jgi:glucose/arabinose dehydrogenase
MAFDDGRLFVADVGQHRYEEVDLVERGGNYGWNVREGTHCFRADDCPDRTPDAVRGGEPLVDPIVEYSHADAPVSGISVIGGQVYRGSALPSLDGRYVFGDLRPAGRLFVATPAADGRSWSTDVLPLADGDAGRLERLRSFGRGPDGEVYVLGTGEEGGGLHRLGTAG